VSIIVPAWHWDQTLCTITLDDMLGELFLSSIGVASRSYASHSNSASSRAFVYASLVGHGEMASIVRSAACGVCINQGAKQYISMLHQHSIREPMTLRRRVLHDGLKCAVPVLGDDSWAAVSGGLLVIAFVGASLAHLRRG
jgi:hypothetical protein